MQKSPHRLAATYLLVNRTLFRGARLRTLVFPSSRSVFISLLVPFSVYESEELTPLRSVSVSRTGQTLLLFPRVARVETFSPSFPFVSARTLYRLENFPPTFSYSPNLFAPGQPNRLDLVWQHLQVLGEAIEISSFSKTPFLSSPLVAPEAA